MGTISFTNIFYWYWFLIAKRTLDLLNFLILIFIIPILPYAIVACKILNESDEHKRAFYGDGSIMILCSGILCSFFAMLFEHRNEIEKNVSKLINSVLFILFIIILFIFYEAQLNFARRWSDINLVIALTTVILIITLFASLYLNFRLKIDNNEVQKFIEETKRKRIEAKAKKTFKSKGGTRV